ncbi:MAG: TolC family protein [Isosphaeraceae bacterium]
MTHRTRQGYWPGAIAIALISWASAPESAAQDPRSLEPPLANPRNDLPFSTLPDTLPGPPRFEGEPPEGASMPPSTLPGRMFGPPIAPGYSPFSPMRQPAPGLVPPGGLLGPAASGLITQPPGTGLSDVPFAEPFADSPGLRGLPGRRGARGPLPSFDFGPAGRPDRPPAAARMLLQLTAPGLPAPPRTLEVKERAAPLTLLDVLGRAEQSYPPFLAYIQERGIAAGNVRSATGSFDLNLNVDSRNWGLGYYKRNLFDVFFEQPTTLWGAKFFAGWRLGVGDWPIYYQYLQTNQGGAYVHGMDVPLLRGGRIDAKRAKLYQSLIERQKVEPAISKQRIELFKNASKAYWNWVAAGQTYAVYEALLKLAELRTRFIERQVELGGVKPIELTDNQRVVLSRENFLISSNARLQEAALELSLYLRDESGLPMIPDPARLPQQFPDSPAPDPKVFAEDLEVSLRLRPELRVLMLEYRKAGIDLQLAENDTLPAMNFYAYGEQNVGAPVALQNKGPYILETSILFDVPLQRRVARGRVQAVNAELRQARLRIQFAQDRIRTDVKEAMAVLQAADQLRKRYRQNVDLNLKLQRAEQQAFDLGSSNVFFLTIREQFTADAKVASIEAESKYQAAVAEYRAALGIDALPPPDEGRQ